MDRSGGIWGLACVALACACGEVRQDDDDEDTVFGSGTANSGKPDDPGALDDEGTSEESSGGGDEAPADDGMTKLDVGAGSGPSTADDGGNTQGCDKVDFLFVIDNSGSMADEQENLITNFPGFMATIQSTLDEAQDYHVMVIDSDRWVFEQCPLICGGFGTCLVNPSFECGVTEPMECEDVLGAGVTYPRGTDASNTDCQFATGQRYMDSSEPDLPQAFQCAARVGTGATSDPEKPMEAMVAAVTPSTDAFACNDGFLRDDAILVVTFITDEDDAPSDGSGGTVEGWKQALVSAKGGDESAIVVLGLFGDNDQPNAVCPPFDADAGNGAEPSPRLKQFVDTFADHGVAGSVCAESYQQFFLDAVGIIDTTCEEFVPPAG